MGSTMIISNIQEFFQALSERRPTVLVEMFWAVVTYLPLSATIEVH